MNLADLKMLFDYHYWARDRMLEALEPLPADQWSRDLGSSFRSIRETAAHTYFAEWAWHERWNGRSPAAPLPLDLIADVSDLKSRWEELERNVRGLLARLGEEGLTRVVEYKLLSGEPSSSPYWQMFQHVVNHASYHRGQMTTMLRQLGAKPPKSMDLIAFHRLQQ